MSTGGGVSVGALIVPKRRAQAVIECLDGCLWRKTRVKPTPHDANTLAIALNPAGARVLDSRLLCGKRQCGEGGTASVEIPAELSKLLDDGEVTWASGLRVGAAAAESPSGAARSVRPPATATFLYAELFAGIGGFRLGLEALGGHCVFASEIDPFAAATYARNFGETPLGDITEIRTESIPAHDVLTAGFPCQSFSRAGAQKGLEDQRGDLFHEIIRVANAQQPRALILENVPNLIHIDRGHALHYIISELCGAGYHVRVQVLNAAALVPQHRERLFLVCFRDAKAADAFRWPYFPSERPPHRRHLSSVLEALDPSRLCGYRLTEDQWTQVRLSHAYIRDPQWRLAQLRGVARTLRSSYRKSVARITEFVPLDQQGRVVVGEGAGGQAGGGAGEIDGGGELDEDEDGDGGGGGVGARGGRDQSAEVEARGTLRESTATAAIVGAAVSVGSAASADATGELPPPSGELPPPSGELPPPAPRFYTVRECARLQGFPESFKLEGERLYVQVGNAVCAPLIEAIGKQVLEALGRREHEREAPKEAIASPTKETDEGDRGGGRAGGGGSTSRCETFLSPSAINLLRGITPPPEIWATDAQLNRYGEESPQQRYERVLSRPSAALFCEKCGVSYSLQASPGHCLVGSAE